MACGLKVIEADLLSISDDDLKEQIRDCDYDPQGRNLSPGGVRDRSTEGGSRMSCKPSQIGVLLLLLVAACGSGTTVRSQGLSEVAGSWTGGEVLQPARPDSQVVYFAVRPDSSLCLALIFEVGPRSRVWTYDIDVTYRDGRISWAYHEGRLNAARDTMWVSKDYRGDRSEWMWVRNRGADPVMARLLDLEESPFEYRVPPETGDGWSTTPPEEAGLDRAGLSRFLQDVSRGTFGDLHSFLLVRHGELVSEAYFARQGAWHGPFIDELFRDRPHHLASVTKSITSILTGIAIGRGSLSGVHAPIIGYLPDHAALLEGDKAATTVEHLLTMSSGLEWYQEGRSALRDDNSMLWRNDDAVGFVLKKPLEAAPGQRFVYSNGSAVVAGAVLENATGMEVEAFAEQHLFHPLGIGAYLWTAGPDGTRETDGGLALRPRDLARIGQMYLAQGRWQGEQVVPADWVAASIEQRHTFRASGLIRPLGYGYFWMQMDLPYGDSTFRAYYHTGDGGQLLMVVPELDLVVVITGGMYGVSLHRLFFSIMREYILPAVGPDA
jgi:CubicO group peptidase (beta-lactamase class C family)